VARLSQPRNGVILILTCPLRTNMGYIDQKISPTSRVLGAYSNISSPSVPKEYSMTFFLSCGSCCDAARATMRNHVRQLYHLELMTRYLCAKHVSERTPWGLASYRRKSESRKNPMSQIFNSCEIVLDRKMVWLSHLPRTANDQSDMRTPDSRG
jgi:hypothetical protein